MIGVPCWLPFALFVGITAQFVPIVGTYLGVILPVLAAVFVGAAIWGPLGALIGIPLVAAGVAILDTYQHRYELVPEISGSGDTLATDTT